MFIPYKFKSMSVENLLAPIKSFLQCETPQAWLEKSKVPNNLSIILIENLICELNVNMCKLVLEA